MRNLRFLGTSLAISLSLLTGCATSRTVRWQENLTDAATRVSELSAEYDATITTVDGARYVGRDVAMARDSVRWRRTIDGISQQMLLAGVASIEVVVERTRKGAYIGSLVGAAGGVGYGAVACSTDRVGCAGADGVVITTLGLIGAAGGALIGWIVGANSPHTVIFVPQQ